MDFIVERYRLESRPNFFIVGAPKCGTTSLYESLRQHPQVFMPHDPRHYWLAKEPLSCKRFRSAGCNACAAYSDFHWALSLAGLKLAVEHSG